MLIGKLRLLVVEDDEDIREVISVGLHLDPEIEVLDFETPMDALQTLGRDPRPPRFALLDIGLPGMSGVELHQELRKLPGLSDLRTVLITAAASEIVDAALNSDGIVGVVSKPFDVLVLARGLRQMFDD